MTFANERARSATTTPGLPCAAIALVRNRLTAAMSSCFDTIGSDAGRATPRNTPLLWFLGVLTCSGPT